MKNIWCVAILFVFLCISVEAAEETLKLIGTDEKTSTSFNVIEKGEMIGSQCERGGFLGGLDVIGIVPDNVALEDDAVAKSLIKKGKDAALVACKFKLSSGELRIWLYKGGYNFEQKRKSEVSAKWEQVYSHEVEEAFRKGPSEYYNSAFERFEKLKLAEERNKVGADASRIIVTEIKLLDTNSSYPRYSPDGSKILYSKEENPKKNQPGRAFQTQIIKDAKTLKTIKTFGKAGTSRKGAWSPDSKKIAYFATPELEMGLLGVSGKLHIYDIESGRIVKLDYMENHYKDFIVWEKEQEIYFLDTAQGGESLNLETLKKDRLPTDVDKRLSQYLKYNRGYSKHEWWFDVSKHKYNYIYREDVARGQPSLIVANTDNSYARVLIDGVFDQHPYIVSPDFTSIVYARGYALYIAYLGKRAEPITMFKIQFSDAPLKEKLESALKNNVIVRGTVFVPRINPLNKKMVGPDEKIFKGNIEFTGSDGSDFIVRTTFEKMSFGDGDIVSEIYAEDGSFGRNSFDQLNLDVWAVLKAQ